ncbi:hypothetical protein [Pseudonocardia sp.]|uniref:hypothetical protein n=1 Tax=Pseudonocardia sp. TaxID=60912 RepID=UPI0026254F61|nr:hypothetical protein [Pseudonocardia sp.]
MLGRAGGRTARSARRTDRLAAAAAAGRERAAELRAGFRRGPGGEVRTPAVADARQDDLVRAVESEPRHRRAGRGHRVVARILPWIDALLFGYFVAGVSNADLTRPWATPVASLVALAFTLFLVLTVAAFTPWLGRELRDQRSPSGQVRFADIGPVTSGLLAVWTVLVLAIGVTMFVRVRTEAGYAGAEPAAAITVAVLLALASVAMTAYVLGVAMSDGSAEADEMRALGRTRRRVESRALRRERRAARLDRRRQRVVRAADRRRARSLVRAGDGLAAVDTTVDLARMRCGASADRPRPAPRTVADLDHREIDTVTAHLAAAPFE